MGELPNRVAQIPFDTDLLAMHAGNPARYPYLLESTASAGQLGRFDILFAFPERSLWLDAEFHLHGAEGLAGDGFLSVFDGWWAEQGGPEGPVPELPFSGGWFLLLGYALANQTEPTLDLAADPSLPVARATRVPAAIIRDRARAEAWIMVEPGYQSCLDSIRADLARLRPGVSGPAANLLSGGLTEAPAADFLDAVAEVRKHIAAGDIYQANLSRRWRGTLRPETTPGALYASLRRTNPAPFAGLAVFEDIGIISSSPERLLRTKGSRVETRPIAGTYPRDALEGRDETRRAQLLAHPKERAEHVMVIDLERNDLGRICRAGSVQVDEFMVVESYAHVHHIVSNVTGQLRDGTPPGRIIRALFPGGSITGCPKVRCMQIIGELEARPRGFYTGAMGYINRDGSGDLNILIRTMTTVGQELRFATGSGIVADSDPLQELEETRAKARGLLLALEHNV